MLSGQHLLYKTTRNLVQIHKQIKAAIVSSFASFTPTLMVTSSFLAVYPALTWYIHVHVLVVLVMCVGVLVGNKVDLVQRRVVSEEDARKTAQTKELEYFECSAVRYNSVCLFYVHSIIITGTLVSGF